MFGGFVTDRKQHRNRIRKPRRQRFPSLTGVITRYIALWCYHWQCYVPWVDKYMCSDDRKHPVLYAAYDQVRSDKI